MSTSLKVILAAAAVAFLASPVMAQSLITRPYVESSADNTYVAPPADNISNAHKSLSHAPANRSAHEAQSKFDRP